MPRPHFSPAALCNSQGHQWRKPKPTSGVPFERCLRCGAERGGTRLAIRSGRIPDDVLAARAIEAAKAGKLASMSSDDLAPAILYLAKVRVDQAFVISKLQKDADYEPPARRERRR